MLIQKLRSWQWIAVTTIVLICSVILLYTIGYFGGLNAWLRTSLSGIPTPSGNPFATPVNSGISGTCVGVAETYDEAYEEAEDCLLEESDACWVRGGTLEATDARSSTIF